MKLIILILALATGLVYATAAQANGPIYQNVCGENPPKYASAVNLTKPTSSPFIGRVKHLCGQSSHAYEIELQRNEAGNWHTVVAGGFLMDYSISCTGSCAGSEFAENWAFEAACGPGSYRLRVYDYTNTTTTTPKSYC